MIDLNKLEEELNNHFNNEPDENIKEWFIKKRSENTKFIITVMDIATVLKWELLEDDENEGEFLFTKSQYNKALSITKILNKDQH